MDDKVLITLTVEHFQCDYELPGSVALSELYPRLLEVLKKDSSKTFGEWKRLMLSNDVGVLSEETANLKDYGICSGSILKVVREV